MKDWAEQINGQLHTKLAGTNEKDLRFFRVAEFERMISRTSELSETCIECKEFKTEIETVVSTIGQAIQTPGKLRRNYDRLIDQIARHQRKAHAYFPPYFFTYNYSFWGMLAGSAFGLLSGFVILPETIWYFVLSGFVFGLLAGQLTGNRKDRRIRASGKLL